MKIGNSPRKVFPTATGNVGLAGVFSFISGRKPECMQSSAKIKGTLQYDPKKLKGSVFLHRELTWNGCYRYSLAAAVQVYKLSKEDPA